MIQTSQEALPTRTERVSTSRRLLQAIQTHTVTAREASLIVGVTEHEATRRCSDLLKWGLVERGEKRRNKATGRSAYVLTTTPHGRAVLRGAPWPKKQSPTRVDLMLAVIQAARNVLARDDAESLRDLHDSLEAFDEGPQGIVDYPYGDKRRRRLLAAGVWLRQSGEEVPVKGMPLVALSARLAWLRRHGASDDDPLVAALLKEARCQEAWLHA